MMHVPACWYNYSTFQKWVDSPLQVSILDSQAIENRVKDQVSGDTERKIHPWLMS